MSDTPDTKQATEGGSDAPTCSASSVRRKRAKKKIASAQEMIDAARVSPEDFLFAIRQVLWIACVWNDHNFTRDQIRESARLCAIRLGCENRDKANLKLQAMLDRVQAEREFNPQNDTTHPTT